MGPGGPDLVPGSRVKVCRQLVAFDTVLDTEIAQEVKIADPFQKASAAAWRYAGLFHAWTAASQ